MTAKCVALKAWWKSRASSRRAKSVTLLLSLLITACPVPAQVNRSLFRSYLSITGSDSNPCTLTQPCRLLLAALTQTQDGGEVWMLDSANYNTDSIFLDQNVTIRAMPGVLGSLVAPNGGPALAIRSPVRVVLRNVVFVDLGGGEGIVANNAKVNLTVEDSQLDGFQQAAIVFEAGQLNVYHSVFRQSFTGILLLDNSSVAASAVIDDCILVGNSNPGGFGVYAINANAIVRNNVISNFSYATYVNGNAVTSLTLDHNLVAGNTYGAYIGNSPQGSSQAGFIYTLGNNAFFNNGSDVSSPAYFSAVQQQ